MIVLGLILIIFLFGMSIFVHELGHFLAARWLGLEIRAFSIGFGKAIWSKTVNGVDYRLGFLPFGGYVMLPQMLDALGLYQKEDGEQLPPVSAGKKVIVALAGGVFNILFAIVLGGIIYVVGIAPVPMERSAKIGYVDPGSEAWAKGVRSGDEILTMRETGTDKVYEVESFRKYLELVTFMGEGVDLELQQADGAVTNVSLGVTYWDKFSRYDIEGIGGLGIVRVGEVVAGSPAEAGGIRAEDVITHIDGEPLGSFGHLVSIVKDNPTNALMITVLREEEGGEVEHVCEVTPQRRYITKATPTEADPEAVSILVTSGEVQTVMRIGIARHTVAKDFRGEKLHPGPIEQIVDAGSQVFFVLQKMLSPKTSGQAMGAISGPLGIFRVLYEVKEDWIAALAITLLVNVNLAIVNLLPLPVLDGGHIVFAFFRMIVGRDPPPRFMIGITQIFIVLIIIMFVFVTYRDYFRFWSKDEPVSAPGVEWVTPEELRERGAFNSDYL